MQSGKMPVVFGTAVRDRVRRSNTALSVVLSSCAPDREEDRNAAGIR